MTDSAASYPTAPPPPAAAPSSTSVPGRTLGIIALIVAFPANVIGIILGIIALVQSRRAGAKNGFAVAAIIVGAVLAVIGIILTIVFITSAAALLSTCTELGTGVWQVGDQTVTCG